jgi:hypothetical protein
MQNIWGKLVKHVFFFPKKRYKERQQSFASSKTIALKFLGYVLLVHVWESVSSSTHLRMMLLNCSHPWILVADSFVYSRATAITSPVNTYER